MKIEQTTLSLPTWSWNHADVEPPFIRDFTPRGQPIYPYPTQEIIDTQSHQRAYQAVIFENDYLRVTFLPELNGRIYSAFDKVNRQELFYNNPVIKPCLFGLRGAWAAVGVEYNFPNSHSVTTLEPIPYKIIEHPDGAASFICGNVDRVSGMSWSVEVNLKPDQACLHMHSRLHNSTAFPKRYYYWVNATVPVYPQSRYIFPNSTTWLYTHPPMDVSLIGRLDYPHHQGRDISVYNNITRHFPVFAGEMHEDFFGIYHPEHHCGLVHVADHALVRGRKLWMFGNARDGRIWMDRLTQNGIDYCELQSGPFSLQSDYRMLRPGAVHTQNETWLPVSNLGGFNSASKHLVANITTNGNGSVCLKYCPAKPLHDAVVTVRSDTRIIVTENLPPTTPLTVQQIELVMPRQVDTANLSVEIRDKSGRTLLTYKNHRVQGGENKTKISSTPTNCLHAQAHYCEQQGDTAKAIKLYEKNANDNTASRVALGRLKAWQGLFTDALDQLNQVLVSEPNHAEAHYYVGICLKNLKAYSRAEKHLSQALDDRTWSQIATYHLAAIALCKQDFKQAQNRLEQLLAQHPRCAHALALYVMVLRKTGQTQKAVTLLQNAGDTCPFETRITAEAYFQAKNDHLLDTHEEIWTDQQAIDIVCQYLEINQLDDALELLNYHLYRIGQRPVAPMVHFYLSYIHMQLGNPKKSQEACQRAGHTADLWLPASRDESEAVLNHVLTHHPENAMAQLQLGNLLASRHRWEQAIAIWKNITGPNTPLSSRAQGLYWWKIKNEPFNALPHYLDACRDASCGAKTLWETDQLLEEMGKHTQRLEVLAQHQTTVDRDNRLLLRLASVYMATDQLERGLAILKKHDFTLCEGNRLPRLLYEKACCQLAEQCRKSCDWDGALHFYQMLLEYPENLGVGKPAANMEAQWHWHCGDIAKQCKNTTQAHHHFTCGSHDQEDVSIAFTPLNSLIPQHQPATPDIPFWTNELFKALCSNEIGDTHTYQQRLNHIKTWITEQSYPNHLEDNPDFEHFKARVRQVEHRKIKSFDYQNNESKRVLRPC